MPLIRINKSALLRLDFVKKKGQTYRDLIKDHFANPKSKPIDWDKYVVVDPDYYRPSEVDDLVGDASKSLERLDWRARMQFRELVTHMVDADVARLDDELAGRLIRADR